MKNVVLLLTTWIILQACSKPIESPTYIRNFNEPASPEEVIDFVKTAGNHHPQLDYKVFGKSEEGVDLIVLRTQTASDENPLRVLIFAQQHGNEQSGKEACLLFIRDLANSSNLPWANNMEIWIVPQINPDGGRVNQRRNSKGIDLNRDHIVKNAVETQALHKLFREFMPHITIDIHEYQPFRDSWKEFGGYKNFDVQVGVNTNINIDESIRLFSLQEALPAIENHLNTHGFSFHNYIVGPVPTKGRTRHSTVDFDDGRQSFGILNTMAFIFEGINGKDGFIDNLENRTMSQYEAIKALIAFFDSHHNLIKEKVENGRSNLNNAVPGEKVAIRMEHFPDGRKLMLPLTSAATGKDTLSIVENYHPVVKAKLEVKRPRAYLIPKADSLLKTFLDLHGIEYSSYVQLDDDILTQYRINEINVSIDEELENRWPEIKASPYINSQYSYWKVHTNQLHSNFLVSIFEPESMLGIAQRKEYQYLLAPESMYSIVRLE